MAYNKLNSLSKQFHLITELTLRCYSRISFNIELTSNSLDFKSINLMTLNNLKKAQSHHFNSNKLFS